MPGRKRILVVDDETVIADSLAMVLSREGYEPKAAYSAEQAMQLLSEWVPDLAIVDVRLRQVNGVEFALKLREDFPGCQVVLYTGLLGLGDMLESARAEGHSFEVLHKPVRPPEMLRFVAGKLSGFPESELTLA